MPCAGGLLDVFEALGEAGGGLGGFAADLGDVAGGLAGLADGVEVVVLSGIEVADGCVRASLVRRVTSCCR